MEISQLTMQAFGPYLGRQHISFEQLREYPIFLITGATGAGKTTIFDAICFALYGKASGSDRDQETLRSQLASPDKKTFVTFTFRLHNRTYRLTRQPKQTIAKERGEGTKEEPAKAELYMDNGEEDQLLASKVRDVDQMVEDMLGLNYEQFRKMMMIPQGEFRKLISENSKEREEVLRKIFDTSLYAEVTEELKRRKGELEKEIEGFRKDISSEFERIHLEKNEELPENPRKAITFIRKDLEEKKAIIEEKVKRKKEKEQLYEDLQKKIKDIENHNARIQEWKEYRTRLQKSDARVEEMKRRGEETEKAEEARMLFEKEDQLIEAETFFGNISERQKKLSEKEALLHQKLLRKEEEERELKEREPERLRLSHKLETLETAMERLGDIQEKEKELKNLQKEEKELDHRIEEQDQKRKTLRNRTSHFTEALNEKVETDDAYFDRKEKWAEVNEEVKTFDQLVFHLQEKEKLRRDKEKVKTEVAALESELAKKEEAIRVADEAKTKDAAYHLSLSLSGEEPCPVCGSSHHPAPASPPMQTIDDKAMERLKEEAASARTRKETKSSEFYRLEADEKAKQETILSLSPSGETPPLLHEVSTWSTEKKKERNSLYEEVERLQKERNEKKEALEQKREAEHQVEKVEAFLSSLKERKNNIYHHVVTIQAEVKEYYRGLTMLEDTPSAENLEATYEKTKREVEDRNRAWEQKQKEMTSLREEWSSLQGTKEQLKETRNDAKERVETKKKEFEQTFEQSSFAEYEEYEQSKVSEEEMQKEKREIEEFFRNRHLLLHHLKELESKLEGSIEPVSDEDVQNRKDELEKEIETLRDTIVHRRYRYEENEASVGRLENRMEEQSGKEELFYDIGDLARTTSGDNPLRLSLERYVLASYLDEILLQANQRLQVMTDYRYQLKRSEGIAKRGAQSGLDLEVMDQYSMQQRSVRTLSGGEGFKASLSLALGMADVVQSYAGGIQLNTLFIDEGFGTLDDVSLQQAIECLKSLQDGNRLLGIISHVPQLKEEIPVQMQVHSDGSESEISMNYL